MNISFRFSNLQRIMIVVFIILIIFCCIGCGKSTAKADPIVGTWNCIDNDHEYFEIYADGTGIYNYGYGNDRKRTLTWHKNGDSDYYTISMGYYHQGYDVDLLVELDDDKLKVNDYGISYTKSSSKSNSSSDDKSTQHSAGDPFEQSSSSGGTCSVCGMPFDDLHLKEYSNTGVCENCAEIVYN